MATTSTHPKIAQNMLNVSSINAYYCLIVPIPRLLLRWCQIVSFFYPKTLSSCIVVVYPSVTTLAVEQCALFTVRHVKGD